MGKLIWYISVTTFGVFIVLITLSNYLLYLYSNRSILNNYRIVGSLLERPQWWQKAANASNIIGQDGASSSFLPDGNVMWIFGDTVLNCTIDGCGWGWSMVTNSAMILQMENGTVIDAFYPSDSGFARQIVPYETTEEQSLFGIWPGAGILVGQQSYLYWEVVNRGNGPWGFSHYAYGKGKAVGTDNNLNFSRLYPDDTSDPASVDCSVLDVDGQYVYFFILNKDPIMPWNDVFIARTLSSQMDTPNRIHSYWTGFGDSFSEKISLKESPAIVSAFGAQISVNWNEFLQQYCMLSTLLGHQVQVLTSQNPWGPWSLPVTVFDIPSYLLASGWPYCAYWHPELWQDRGRIMVFSFCITEGGDGLPYLASVEFNSK